MNHSPAELLRASLVGARIGVFPSKTSKKPWPVFVGHMPDDPDDVICVYDTAPVMDGRLQETGETVKHLGFQVRVRSFSYRAAYAKITTIDARLDDIRREGIVINGESYIIAAVTKTSGPLAMGQEPDGKRRENFTLNGTMTVRNARERS